MGWRSARQYREYHPEITELDGDLTYAEVIEILAQLRFDGVHGYEQTVVLDGDVRDALVSALRRRKK